MICSKGIPKFSKIAFLTGKITQSSIMMESKIEKIIVLLICFLFLGMGYYYGQNKKFKDQNNIYTEIILC